MSFDPQIPLSPATFSSQQIGGPSGAQSKIEKQAGEGTGKTASIAGQDTAKVSEAVGGVLTKNPETSASIATSRLSVTQIYSEGGGQPAAQVKSVLKEVIEPKKEINEKLDVVEGKLEFIRQILKNISSRQELATHDTGDDLNIEHLKEDLGICLDQFNEIMDISEKQPQLDLERVDRDIASYEEAVAQLQKIQSAFIDEGIPQLDEAPLTDEPFFVPAAPARVKEEFNPVLDMLSFRLPEPEFPSVEPRVPDAVDNINWFLNHFEGIKPLKEQLDVGAPLNITDSQMGALIDFHRDLQDVEGLVKECQKTGPDAVLTPEEQALLAPTVAKYESIRTDYWNIVDGLYRAADEQNVLLPLRDQFIEIHKNKPLSF